MFNRVGGASGVVLRCFCSTVKEMAGCLVSHVPRWNLHSAVALGPHATVAVSFAAARSKCVCSHWCCSEVAWAVGMWW